jgi:hypothetical protein
LLSPEARELAQLLVRKAQGDEAALLKLLNDSEISDELCSAFICSRPSRSA